MAWKSWAPERCDPDLVIRYQNKMRRGHASAMKMALLFIFVEGTAMLESFSSGLRFSPGDLNDFLLPSEQCVLPLQNSLKTRSIPTKKTASQKHGNQQLKLSDVASQQLDAKKLGSGSPLNANPLEAQAARSQEGGFVGHEKSSKSSPVVDSKKSAARDAMLANISLSDCLSCSGCLTSSEEILLGKHSASLLQNMSADPNVTVIVSISPQACASISQAHGLSVEDAAGKLASFLKSLGVSYVLSTSVSNTIALREACEEFEQRWMASRSGQYEKQRSFLPVLSSECPGITVYLEKTQAKAVVKLLSKVKSPQAIASTILKRACKHDQRTCNKVIGSAIVCMY